MLNKELNGIAPSLHTPFKKDFSIDYDSFKRLIDHTIRTNCSGILICAVAGETKYLKMKEKLELTEFVLKYVDNRIPVIVGCSAETPKDSKLQANYAKKLGAKWFLVQSPNDVFGVELVDIFNEISSVGPENLMIQDLSWNGYGLKDEDILLIHKNLDAFKALKIEVKNSGPKYSKILSLTNNQLHLSGGWAVMELIEAINRGVHSFIPSTMEVLYNEIYSLVSSGKLIEARKLFYKLIPIISFTHQHIDRSILFSKMLRVKEKIFDTSLCRGKISNLDYFQKSEAKILLDYALKLQNDFNRY